MNEPQINLILASITDLKIEIKQDFHRLEDRVNYLADQGLPAQMGAIQKRVDILSQRLWLLATGWLFTLAGWAWSLSR